MPDKKRWSHCFGTRGCRVRVFEREHGFLFVEEHVGGRHRRRSLQTRDRTAALQWAEKRLEWLENRPSNGVRLPFHDVAGSQAVYVIATQDLTKIKVGVSARPEQRLAALQVASGEPLQLLAVFPGRGHGLEKRLHKALAEYKLSGEWFTYVPAVRELLLALAIPRARTRPHTHRQGQPVVYEFSSDGR